MGEVSSGLLHLHQQISAPDPYKLKLWSFFVQTVDRYCSWHKRRILEVKPGITGLWQVEGRSILTFDEAVRLDIQYAETWNLLLDLKLILKTVKVVLSGKGAC